MTWQEYFGINRVEFHLPDVYCPNLYTGEIWSTRKFFRDGILSNLTKINSNLSTNAIFELSSLPIVQIVYSNSSTNPGTPTSQNMGYSNTWNRDTDLANWCAYRYK